VATVGYVGCRPVLCGVYLEGESSRIVAANGETTHVSEQYTTKAAAIRTAERLLADIHKQQQSGGQVEVRDVTGEEPAL
jgi:hypothetical protein